MAEQKYKCDRCGDEVVNVYPTRGPVRTEMVCLKCKYANKR